VSTHSPATTQKTQQSPETEPPIVCAFIRGDETWRFVFPRREWRDALEAARWAPELDAFDLAWLELLIIRALRGEHSRCTTVLTPRRRRDASARDRFISRTTWNKD
jgi:hypothetical protein